MPQVIETTVFTFEELNDSAKDSAREWFRSCMDSNDYDSVIEQAAEAAAMLGLDLRTRAVKLMGGGTRFDPCIYWSGFSSQGDGANFEGTYRYVKGAAAKVKAEFPQDRELNRIAAELQSVQRRYLYSISAGCSVSGRYSHSRAISVDVESDRREVTSQDEESVTEALRDFADWIYSSLRAENEYRDSDEQVDESILCNEYTFTEDGSRA